MLQLDWIYLNLWQSLSFSLSNNLILPNQNHFFVSFGSKCGCEYFPLFLFPFGFGNNNLYYSFCINESLYFYVFIIIHETTELAKWNRYLLEWNMWKLTYTAHKHKNRDRRKWKILFAMYSDGIPIVHSRNKCKHT